MNLFFSKFLIFRRLFLAIMVMGGPLIAMREKEPSSSLEEKKETEQKKQRWLEKYNRRRARLGQENQMFVEKKDTKNPRRGVFVRGSSKGELSEAQQPS